MAKTRNPQHSTQTAEEEQRRRRRPRKNPHARRSQESSGDGIVVDAPTQFGATEPPTTKAGRRIVETTGRRNEDQLTSSGRIVRRNPKKGVGQSTLKPFFEDDNSGQFSVPRGSTGKKNPGPRGRTPFSQIEDLESNPFFEKDNSGQFSNAQTGTNVTAKQFDERLELPVIPGGFSRLNVRNPGGIPLTESSCPNCRVGLKIAPGVTGGICICGAKLQINPSALEDYR